MENVVVRQVNGRKDESAAVGGEGDEVAFWIGGVELVARCGCTKFKKHVFYLAVKIAVSHRPVQRIPKQSSPRL